MEKHETRHKCIIAVAQNGCAVVLNSEPSLFEKDDFDGFYLDDNVNIGRENIPKELGVYRCDIMVRHYSYWTDAGTEYDCNVWLENIIKLTLITTPPLTDEHIEKEAEGRYPVQTHSCPGNSPYVGSKKTFIHGIKWAEFYYLNQ